MRLPFLVCNQWFVQCGHFASKEGYLDVDINTFGAKSLPIFLNFWCVRIDWRGG